MTTIKVEKMMLLNKVAFFSVIILLVAFPSRQKLSIKSVDYSGKDLKGCDFSDAQIWNSVFDNTNLEGCDFSNASIFDSSFRNSQMKFTSFNNAKIVKSNLTKSNFSYADFTNATIFNNNLNGAMFSYAYFFGTDFTSSEGIQLLGNGAIFVNTIRNRAELEWVTLDNILDYDGIKEVSKSFMKLGRWQFQTNREKALINQQKFIRSINIFKKID